MIFEETVNKLVRDIINSILDTPDFSIKAKQDGPRPQGEYADVDFVTDTSIGWEEKVQNTNAQDLDETISGAREIMLSLGFYRTNSMDNARKVRTAFMRQSVLDTLRAATMGLTKRSDVRDISEVLSGNWEERTQFDLTLSAVGSDTDIITAIESIDIDGEFQTRGRSIPISVEVNT